MSLASSIASASSRNGTTTATGPKISSRDRAVGALDRAQHGRRVPVARAVGRAAADRHRRALGHERGDGLALAGRDQRAHLGRLVERVADLDRLDRLLERLHERVERRALDEDARARAAVLAGVAEHRARRGRRGGLDVGVGEHDVGGLAAQLERHALDRLRGARGDRPPDLGRAGERDLGDVGVLDEPLPAGAPGAGDDVDDALRDARRPARCARTRARSAASARRA